MPDFSPSLDYRYKLWKLDLELVELQVMCDRIEDALNTKPDITGIDFARKFVRENETWR